jgi:predicted TIM-barrel fold metal-dependent hydrolase
MAVEGFTVIDCHHHVGTLEAQGLRFGEQSPGSDPMEVDLALRLKNMGRLGADQAILIPGHGYLRPAGAEDTRRVNDGIARYRDQRPDCFPAALGIAEPLHGAAGLAELRRMRDELGLVGLSVHARFQGVQTDSPLVIALVVEAVSLGLVPFIHAVDGVPDEALWRVKEVARRVPESPVVVLDALGGSEHARQAVIIGQETQNLIFDTSLAHHYMFVEMLLSAIGHERLVFGTDYYSMMPGPQPSTVLDELIAGSLADDHKASVLSGNLRRVLQLGVRGNGSE